MTKAGSGLWLSSSSPLSDHRARVHCAIAKGASSRFILIYRSFSILEKTEKPSRFQGAKKEGERERENSLSIVVTRLDEPQLSTFVDQRDSNLVMINSLKDYDI